jgi:hypothetical protein
LAGSRNKPKQWRLCQMINSFHRHWFYSISSYGAGTYIYRPDNMISFDRSMLKRNLSWHSTRPPKGWFWGEMDNYGRPGRPTIASLCTLTEEIGQMLRTGGWLCRLSAAFSIGSVMILVRWWHNSDSILATLPNVPIFAWGDALRILIFEFGVKDRKIVDSCNPRNVGPPMWLELAISMKDVPGRGRVASLSEATTWIFWDTIIGSESIAFVPSSMCALFDRSQCQRI